MGRPAKYPPQSRREAIALVRSSGRGVAEVAAQQEIDLEILRKAAACPAPVGANLHRERFTQPPTERTEDRHVNVLNRIEPALEPSLPALIDRGE